VTSQQLERLAAMSAGFEEALIENEEEGDPMPSAKALEMMPKVAGRFVMENPLEPRDLHTEWATMANAGRISVGAWFGNVGKIGRRELLLSRDGLTIKDIIVPREGGVFSREYSAEQYAAGLIQGGHGGE
jgi:hypothetical protein